MRWLTIRLRARRINQISMSRLRAKFMRHCNPTEDNEQQADLCAQFEMRRRRVTASDLKAIRNAKGCSGCDWQSLEEKLESTRIQRILGWGDMKNET